MSRLLNNFLVVLLCVITLASCSFINLKPIGISTEPKKNNAVLPDYFSPVIIKFDTEMKKRDTEGILQISSNLGVINGDKKWSGNNLYFTPESGWTAGIRYNLNLSGTIRSADGREERIEQNIFFYAINKKKPPLLERHSPLNGESVGTKDIVYEFHFTESMNRFSVESAATLDGIGNKTFEWSDNDKTLKIKADKALSPWIYYRWNLKDSAKSVDGVPLAKAYSGYFITDLDHTLPEVTGIYPVLFSDGSWYPTGAEIETGLDTGQGIAVSFNKPMDENVLRSLRFEPSLAGRSEYLSEKSIVYIFSKDPEPETTYTLIISGDTKDSEGLKIGSDVRINFSVNIPYLNILSLSVNNETDLENISKTNNVIPITVSPIKGELSVSIRFSLLFNTEEKQNTPQKIILSPFFPRLLSPVALQYVNWISDDRLSLKWEGLAGGDNEISHYYKITIPGGKNGIVSENGFYLKEDIVLYLEAVK